MSTRANLVANVAGRVWAALMSFAFVPIYIRFMGIEAYGLVGFFASLLAIFFVLDMGLSTTLNREMARVHPSDDGVAAARTLLRTLEIIYWTLGVAICLLVIVASPWIAGRWLNSSKLQLDQVTMAVRLMGLTLMLRWPVSLYQGALMGLRRHVGLNIATSLAASLAGVGAVVVLWFVSASITAFFAWQAVAAAVQIALLYRLTWRGVSLQRHRPRFSAAALRGILRFSAGVTGITLLSVVLTQLDKVLLVKLLPLEQFGYYALAGAIAAVLTTAAGAIHGAIFPAIANLTATGRTEELKSLYHRSAQLVSLAVIPAGITLALFSRELLALYTGNAILADRTAPLLSLLTVGNIFLSLMILPLALQLAAGWTQLSVWKNVVAVAAFVPLLFFLVGRYGAAGAAMVWIMLTLGYFLLEIPIMHRRLLRTEKWRWYLVDVGTPFVVSSFVLGSARLLLPTDLSAYVTAGFVLLAAATALGGSALAVPLGREQVHRIRMHFATRRQSATT